MREGDCDLKLFRRDDCMSLRYFDEVRRYLPALFRPDGWQTMLVYEHAERPHFLCRNMRRRPAKTFMSFVRQEAEHPRQPCRSREMGYR